ncbi:DUF169 domain-containing protein [uncultured Methanoregula sp.]|uniref:DUF169 domain-containing protein n=1 Tax=uncultured Methanoregula sp. TaxID=1005933 RepID=UPI002AAC3716|nr:DUF169 domain-containing protein [uncultured Methanoregula sp.]
MTSAMKIQINYTEAAEVLKKYLKLRGSPVAFRFATKKEEIPAGMEKIDKTIRHCSMVGLARNEGRIFYALADNHECNGGAWSLGLREITETLKTGDFYFRLGKFESAGSCKRTIDRVAHLNCGDTYATLYAPLEKTPFDPQVVLIVASPWAMLKLSQSSLFRLGGRINAEFAGIQSVCADTCAQTYLNGKINFSLGCDGSRKFSGIEDGEMVMGIPAELLPELTEALKIVAAAPGSK